VFHVKIIPQDKRALRKKDSSDIFLRLKLRIDAPDAKSKFTAGRKLQLRQHVSVRKLTEQNEVLSRLAKHEL